MIVLPLPCTLWVRRITTERTVGELGFMESRLRLIYAGIVRSDSPHNPPTFRNYSSLPLFGLSQLFSSVALTRYFHFTWFSHRPQSYFLIAVATYRHFRNSGRTNSIEKYLRSHSKDPDRILLANAAVPLSYLPTRTGSAISVGLLANPYLQSALCQREGLETIDKGKQVSEEEFLISHPLHQLQRSN